MSKKDKTIYNQSTSTANPVWMLSIKKNKIDKDKDLDKKKLVII